MHFSVSILCGSHWGMTADMMAVANAVSAVAMPEMVAASFVVDAAEIALAVAVQGRFHAGQGYSLEPDWARFGVW